MYFPLEESPLEKREYTGELWMLVIPQSQCQLLFIFIRLINHHSSKDAGEVHTEHRTGRATLDGELGGLQCQLAHPFPIPN